MKLTTHWTQTDSTHPNNSQGFARLVGVIEQRLPDVIDRFPHLDRHKIAVNVLSTLAHAEGLEPRKYREAAEAAVAQLAAELEAARTELAVAAARLATVEVLRDSVAELQSADPDTGDRVVSWLALDTALGDDASVTADA